MEDEGVKLLQRNKKAFFNYEIVETLECGISLVGTEVKSIRKNAFSFKDSYVKIDKKGNLVLHEFHIAQYAHGTIENHDPGRPRRLLAHHQEIKRLKRKVDEKGFTLIPTRVYLKRSLVKVEIGLARGKKLHDKRNSIRDRDLKREADRTMKQSF